VLSHAIAMFYYHLFRSSIDIPNHKLHLNHSPSLPIMSYAFVKPNCRESLEPA
jgi:hypothetical protein